MLKMDPLVNIHQLHAAVLSHTEPVSASDSDCNHPSVLYVGFHEPGHVGRDVVTVEINR